MTFKHWESTLNVPLSCPRNGVHLYKYTGKRPRLPALRVVGILPKCVSETWLPQRPIYHGAYQVVISRY